MTVRVQSRNAIVISLCLFVIGDKWRIPIKHRLYLDLMATIKAAPKKFCNGQLLPSSKNNVATQLKCKSIADAVLVFGIPDRSSTAHLRGLTVFSPSFWTWNSLNFRLTLCDRRPIWIQQELALKTDLFWCYLIQKQQCESEMSHKYEGGYRVSKVAKATLPAWNRVINWQTSFPYKDQG